MQRRSTKNISFLNACMSCPFMDPTQSEHSRTAIEWRDEKIGIQALGVHHQGPTHFSRCSSDGLDIVLVDLNNACLPRILDSSELKWVVKIATGETTTIQAQAAQVQTSNFHQHQPSKGGLKHVMKPGPAAPAALQAVGRAALCAN